jgi:imidazolonepropionase-like amidohydrolase
MRIAALLAVALTACGETKVLKNFTLIDGTGRPPAAAMAMIVVDGRIQSVGLASKIKAPKGAEVIDLAGKFVMPGVINTHGHVGATVGMQQNARLYSKENVEKDLATYAWYGVTTVMSLGTDLDPVFEVRAAQRASGRPHSARLYTAGRGFTLKNGNPAGGGMRYEVATKEEIAKDVDELAAKHVDIVKMWVDDNFGRGKKLPIELSSAVIADAKQHGLHAAAHIVDLEDARELVDAGIYALAHSVRDKEVDQGLMDAMKQRGVYQIATLTRELSTFVFAESPKFLDDPFLKRSAPDDVIAAVKSERYVAGIRNSRDFPRLHGLLDMAEKNLKRESDAGVRICFGTDTGPPGRFLGYFEQLELELMTDAGLTPMQVIQAATKTSAEFLGAHDLGTLERGKWADLMVLTKNPVEDIKNTRSIEAVYIAGNAIAR